VHTEEESRKKASAQKNRQEPPQKGIRIAVGQINTKIADFAGNKQKIIDYSRRAAAAGADMIVFPELSVCGYPPLDLLTYRDFVERNRETVRELCRELPEETAAVIGYVDLNDTGTGKPLKNTAAVIINGEIVFQQAKTLLPTYDVFDEDRYFEPASERVPFRWKGRSFGFVICEDMWVKNVGDLGLNYAVDPSAEMVAAGADVLVSLSASPFHIGKAEERRKLLQEIAEKHHVPAVYVNAVGANDSLIFDGGSMAVDDCGTVFQLCPVFDEDLRYLELKAGTVSADAPENRQEDAYENLEQALILGVRDYVRKSGFKKVNLGLSGGIDSALTAVIAARAVGPEQVHAYAMPSRYSSEHSLTDARKLAENLGIGYEEIPIEQCFSAFLGSLEESFAGREPDVTEENIQARIRGVMLMAWSNKMGSLLLTTGNKSEMAVGYCTLYGDMCGSIAVIGDLFKSEVFALCRDINRRAGYDLIPQNTLDKPPSAELRPDQKDEDSLPSYEVLDAVLHMHLVERASVQDITAAGYDYETVRKVLTLVERNEYKRRQAAIVLKVSRKAFGFGRQIPMARSLYEFS